MRYSMSRIMTRAWEIRRERSATMMTALKLAWRETKGEKGYTFRLEDVRPQISAYLWNLLKGVRDVHDQHNADALKAALLAGTDADGIAVLDGKTVGLCKYAVRNA